MVMVMAMEMEMAGAMTITGVIIITQLPVQAMAVTIKLVHGTLVTVRHV